MNQPMRSVTHSNSAAGPTRRDFLQNTGRIAAVTAAASLLVPKVHAAEDNTLRVALVGCGGRGTGAADNALSTYNKQHNPIKLVAMADVFDHRLKHSAEELQKKHGGDKFDVPEDRRFIGFDGYQKAIDCLTPGDIAIFATPPAFRWVHFGYAIEKNLNVFMEKPVTVDGPTSRRMLELGEKSVAKNLKVGVGLMCRHCEARGELSKRVKDGEIGDITLLRAYRVSGPTGSAFSAPKPADFASELLWQISRFHSFLWASGGAFSDFLIHNIDECCWIKDAWPISARALGGRHYRGNNIDQNFDNYSVEYTFADGAKLFLEGRGMDNCWDKFSSQAHGTKGSAIISKSSHWPSKAAMFKGQDQENGTPFWTFGAEKSNPYQKEWQDLVDAVRNNTPYNEVERGVKASLVTSMGRFAAHTGKVTTLEEMRNNDHEFAPGLDKLTMDSPAPLRADASGAYPIPQPGIVTNREY